MREVISALIKMQVCTHKIHTTSLQLSGSTLADDELCCGTFWLEEGFLSVNLDMEPDEIASAMEYAEVHHDAKEGFNWWHLEMAIDAVLPEKEDI